MTLFLKISSLLIAYLLGSIPSSVWIGKKFYGIDVRDHGSKNAGTTNTIRILGWKPGLIVFLMDVIKGFAAVNLVRIFGDLIPGTTEFVTVQLFLGVAAVLGHIFPVYAHFRGGKGVATLLGVVLALHTPATLVCLAIFLVFLFSTKYVSLSSIIAGISFPILVIFIFKTTIPSLIVFSLAVSVLLILTHQKNIERLLNKEENKAAFLQRKKHHKED